MLQKISLKCVQKWHFLINLISTRFAWKPLTESIKPYLILQERDHLNSKLMPSNYVFSMLSFKEDSSSYTTDSFRNQSSPILTLINQSDIFMKIQYQAPQFHLKNCTSSSVKSSMETTFLLLFQTERFADTFLELCSSKINSKSWVKWLIYQTQQLLIEMAISISLKMSSK